MSTNIRKELYKAIGLGAMAGMRTFSAPAFLSYALCRKRSAQKNILNNYMAANALRLLAMGEIIGDKHPQAPDRIALPGLAGRAISGALAGAAIYTELKARKNNVWAGAAIGALSAITAAYASFYLRKGLNKAAHIPDPLLGAIEDVAVAVGCACLVNE